MEESIDSTLKLLGLRAALSVHNRKQEYTNNEVLTKLKNTEYYHYWKEFIEQIEKQQETEPSLLSKTTFPERVRKIIKTTSKIINNLNSLRGRTINAKIKLPSQNKYIQTEYSLIQSLRHYKINKIERNNGEPIIQLSKKEPEKEPQIKNPITEEIQPYTKIDNTTHKINDIFIQNKRETPPYSQKIIEFYKLTKPRNIILPEKIKTQKYEIKIEKRKIKSITKK